METRKRCKLDGFSRNKGGELTCSFLKALMFFTFVTFGHLLVTANGPLRICMLNGTLKRWKEVATTFCGSPDSDQQ